MTWNIWLMPDYIFQSPLNEKRAATIASDLLKQDFDILCLQKDFSDRARRILSKALAARYPYQYGPANSGFSLKINSGVWVASRIPLSDYHEIQFKDSAGIEWFSRKGAMLLTGEFRGHRFQVLATHLQGEEGTNYTSAHQIVREKQMGQIVDELLERYAEPNTPLFLCGEFDTPRQDMDHRSQESAVYKWMLAKFGDPQNHRDFLVTMADVCGLNDLAIDNGGRQDELDYIFVKPGSVKLKTAWSRLILLHPGWDGRTARQNLSYRYAMEAIVEFE